MFVQFPHTKQYFAACFAFIVITLISRSGLMPAETASPAFIFFCSIRMIMSGSSSTASLSVRRTRSAVI